MILFTTKRFNVSVNLQGQLYLEVDHQGTTLEPQEARDFLNALEKAKPYCFAPSEKKL